MAKTKNPKPPKNTFFTRADADERCACGQSYSNPKANHQWFCPEKNKRKKQ